MTALGTKWIADVVAFNATMGVLPVGFPLTPKRIGLRTGLIMEECAEVVEATRNYAEDRGGINEVAKELADLAYVTIGVLSDIPITYELDSRKCLNLSVGQVKRAEIVSKIAPMGMIGRCTDLVRALTYGTETAVCQQVYSVMRRVVGAAADCGIPFDEVWDVVHAANMAKVGGPKDPITGKQLKPVGWTPPDVAGVLIKHGFILD